MNRFPAPFSLQPKSVPIRLNFGIYIRPLRVPTLKVTPQTHAMHPHHMDQVSHGFAVEHGPKELFAPKRIWTLNLMRITAKVQGLHPFGWHIVIYYTEHEIYVKWTKTISRTTEVHVCCKLTGLLRSFI